MAGTQGTIRTSLFRESSVLAGLPEVDHRDSILIMAAMTAKTGETMTSRAAVATMSNSRLSLMIRPPVRGRRLDRPWRR